MEINYALLKPPENGEKIWKGGDNIKLRSTLIFLGSRKQ